MWPSGSMSANTSPWCPRLRGEICWLLNIIISDNIKHGKVYFYNQYSLMTTTPISHFEVTGVFLAYFWVRLRGPFPILKITDIFHRFFPIKCP